MAGLVPAIPSPTVLIAGLDPAIHLLFISDGPRVKPGGDE
jgi:hypothetical protein